MPSRPGLAAPATGCRSLRPVRLCDEMQALRGQRACRTQNPISAATTTARTTHTQCGTGFFGAAATVCRAARRRWRDGRVEAREEIVRHLARSGVDEPRADLGELAADRGLGGVGELGASRLRRQADLCATLAEPGRASGAFEAQRIGVGRVQVGQLQLAAELRLDRADRSGHGDLVFGVGQLLDAVAPGNAGLQHLRVVECLPDPLLGQGDVALSRHVHVSCLLLVYRLHCGPAPAHAPGR